LAEERNLSLQRADLIKTLGDWKSDAYQLYMYIQDHVRTSAASMMAAAASACK
jgi:hypothetical protein